MTSGSFCVGQSLCHSGGAILLIDSMFSMVFQSLSPLILVYSMRSSSPIFISVFSPGCSFLALYVFLDRSANLLYSYGGMNGVDFILFLFGFESMVLMVMVFLCRKSADFSVAKCR